ncbi:hypothetical protein [Streptomyces sp. FH025]|uniref:hypothetical protein n=1 Tax=Streptomyces sp. FH025 TaxID=2815937 RepID=UPI001A9CD8B0|nr:hypothetical protein [Streptomyces sp. FH025]MBO1418910.1 hypothetical protein [Streptomyces sp. FH025]
MTTDTAPSRRPASDCGRHRDVVGASLAALWGLGHIVTLALLGIVAEHQLGGDHPVAMPPARALPDHEPAV